MTRRGQNPVRCLQIGGREPHAGFSLIELLIAMAIFLVISAAAFKLFTQQQVASTSLQGEAGLNMALRNAISMLQMDLSNAGNGYYPGTTFPGWPIGVTMINRAGAVSSVSSCYTSSTSTYGANCFDQISIIMTAGLTPLHLTDSTGLPPYCSQTTDGFAYALSPLGTTASATATAASYLRGDQLLFLNQAGTLLSTVVLTANAQAVGTLVKFQFNTSNANGTNTPANDPLNITTCYDGGTATGGKCPQDPVSHSGFAVVNAGGTSVTTYQFCATDWVVKLAPITYQVDTSDPSNPKLTRTAGGVTSTVMEQIIGFRVGGALWNDGSPDTQSQAANYNYDASSYYINTSGSTNVNVPFNFNLVRSLRISLIGRTAPNLNATYQFRNAFDNGPYQVQGTSVVVNPRNMSMNDQ